MKKVNNKSCKASPLYDIEVNGHEISVSRHRLFPSRRFTLIAVPVSLND